MKTFTNAVEKERTHVEAKAKEFIKQRHSRVEWVLFRTVYKEKGNWVLQGELQFKRAYFFAFSKSFKLQINTDTGEVTFYEETRPFAT